MLVYLARPNDHVQDGYTIRVGVQTASRVMENAAIAWYDPILPFGMPMSDAGACYDINEAALQRSDVVLAIYPPGVPSTGVPMEIQTAHLAGKPVAVVGGGRSMQLQGMGVRQFPWDVGEETLRAHIVSAISWLQETMQTRIQNSMTIKWIGAPDFEPRRGVVGDAGFDLIVSEACVIRPGDFVDIPCGIAIELPHDCWAMVTGRSSTLRKRGVLIHTAIIDQGYRGPLFAGAWNLGDKIERVNRSERIAQIIPMPLAASMLSLRHVEELAPSIRGDSGFGSTGC